MDIDKASLLELKAELIRKKREVESVKLSSQGYVRPTPKVKLKTISDKVNEGVARRDQLDQSESAVNASVNAEDILQRKARLYEKLQAEGTNEGDSTFLVNFAGKEKVPEPDKESDLELEDVDDSDWVDYVDRFGRTRRCLKEDLEKMTVEKPAAAMESQPAIVEEDVTVQDELSEQELLKRELLRQKWEKQELENLGAKDIHYQDLLFDEARTHGVGYYAFSKDEEERKRQQQNLKNIRKEAQEEQAARKIAEESKQRQKKERLLAAKRRRRERLGLPPEDENVEDEPEEEAVAKPPVEEMKPDENLKNLRKAAPEREWDMGKDDPDRVLTQEEWVARKRDERPSEFAPPSTFEPTPNWIKEWTGDGRLARPSDFAPPGTFGPPSMEDQEPPKYFKKRKKRSVSSEFGNDKRKDLARPSESGAASKDVEVEWEERPPSEFVPPSKFEPFQSSKKKKEEFIEEKWRKSSTSKTVSWTITKAREETVQKEYLQDFQKASESEKVEGMEPRAGFSGRAYVREEASEEKFSQELHERVRCEIPPPPCLEDKPQPKILKSNLAESIDEGLKFLREQIEKRKQKDRVFPDFI